MPFFHFGAAPKCFFPIRELPPDRQDMWMTQNQEKQEF
jgi:hypothetical protein